MRKIYDIKPPRHSSGTSPVGVPEPKVAKDLSALEVQPHDWHIPGRHDVPKAEAQPIVQEVIAEADVLPKTVRPLRDSLGKKLFAMTKRGGMYLMVGLVSFIFFSLLFYGFNQYQEKQRQALQGQSSGVSGESTEVNPSRASVRILNASGNPDHLQQLKDTLESKGYPIRSIGTSAQPSDKTIIYYKTNSQEVALTLTQHLASFSPSLEQNNDLTGFDDIVILLGSASR